MPPNSLRRTTETLEMLRRVHTHSSSLYLPVPASSAVETHHAVKGISPLGYWQEVNLSPTQTKPYNTLPPFEQRDSWSSYGVVRAYSEVLFWGPRESDSSDS